MSATIRAPEVRFPGGWRPRALSPSLVLLTLVLLALVPGSEPVLGQAATLSQTTSEAQQRSSSLRRSQWLSVGDAPVALDIARAEERLTGRSFLLVRTTSVASQSAPTAAPEITDLTVRVSATGQLKSADTALPTHDCEVVQRTMKDLAGTPTSNVDAATEEQVVWRCQLSASVMQSLLERSDAKLALGLATEQGLQQAVTVELGWVRRRRLSNLR